TNLDTGATGTTTAGADGSFATFLPAAVGQRILLAATDTAGNTGPPTTVTVSATTSLPPAVATLRFDGVILDRLRAGRPAPARARADDAVFEVDFGTGPGITRQLSFIDLVGPTPRSPRPEVASVLGVAKADDLGAPLLNHADGTIDASVTANGSFVL